MQSLFTIRATARYYVNYRSLYRLWRLECRRLRFLERANRTNAWLRKTNKQIVSAREGRTKDDPVLEETYFAVGNLWGKFVQKLSVPFTTSISHAEKMIDEMYAIAGHLIETADSITEAYEGP